MLNLLALFLIGNTFEFINTLSGIFPNMIRSAEMNFYTISINEFQSFVNSISLTQSKKVE
jgi:hypothetical protein